MAADKLFRGGTIVTPGGRFTGDIAVSGGVITAITSGEARSRARETVDLTGKLILPGPIDPHVHIRYPGGGGRESFATGTRAAAAGGITTILEHPVSTPSVHSAQIFHARHRACQPGALVDFGFYGGAGEENLEQLAGLAQAGVVAFKSFLHRAPEGREEDFFGVTVTGEGALGEVLGEVARTGRLAAVHAESDDMISHGIRAMKRAGRHGIRAHHDSRPVLAELVSCASVLELAREAGARLLVCHVSGGTVARHLREARERGYDVLVETCPHYLFVNLDQAELLGPYAKINPPIRSGHEQDLLWEELWLGGVDFIGSDHVPYFREEKERGWDSIWVAPSGAPGLETTLPLLLDASFEGRLRLEDIAFLLSENTSRQYGLWPRKGCLWPGSDADLTVVSLESSHTVDRARMFTQSREQARLYEGRSLRGRVEMTVVRGRIVYSGGEITGEEGWGQLVTPLA